MGKVVGIYMNKGEQERLEALGKQLGHDQISKTVKLGLKLLEKEANGHAAAEHSFKVLIPPEVTLQGFVRECCNEEAREWKVIEKAREQERELKARQKASEESTNRLVDAMYGVMTA